MTKRARHCELMLTVVAGHPGFVTRVAAFMAEPLDGADPSIYRKWKRRAQLMLAALPSTVPKEKLGPRLMQHIKGEAELVCEAIPVEKVVC